MRAKIECSVRVLEPEYLQRANQVGSASERRPQRDLAGLSRWAMCGRLPVGKKNLHFAALVGAAMCSAFLRGTHDRWP
jgi:hypothetical protein